MTVRTRVLALDQHLLYVQRGRKLLALDVENDNRVLESIDLVSSSWMEWTRLGTRLLRLGVHALCLLGDGVLVFVIKGKICRYSPLDKRLRMVFSIPRGSRPLFLCRTLCGSLYFGEYFGNQDRQAVHIYGSQDGGQRFDIVYTFPPGAVRHVHGVFADPYSDLLWVTTGDTDRESAIWVTSDQFGHLEKVVGGAQQYRAVQLLFTDQFVYFGSDTPLEQNYLYRLARETGQVERLQSVQRPVFYGCKVGDALFFSTVVEPSSASLGREVCLWGSPDGDSWKCLAKFRKDLWPMKYFQYGQLLFPSGENNTGRLWFTPLATEHDQTLQCLDIHSLFQE